MAARSGATGDAPRGRGRSPRRPTPERLHNRALAYLRRYATTGAHLRHVLLRRARPEAAAHAIEPIALAAMVDEVVARLVEAGLVDDRSFAATRARRLAGEGNAPGRIREKLRLKGLDARAIGTALERVAEETGDVELAAAMAFARRRRLGPWRGEVPADPARELAAFARAGFAYGVARRVVEAAAVEELEMALGERGK